MKVVITGGAGYLGSVVVENLLAQNHEVAVLDILMFGGESLLPYLNNKRFSFYKGDARDQSLINTILSKKFDAIIHLAALVGEPACIVNPQLTKSINHEATILLGKKAKESGVSLFLFTSTCSNYGVSSSNELATEESALQPLSLYAETKIRAEKELLAFASKDFSACVLRFATIFGLSPKMRFNLFINEVVREAFMGKEVLIYKENAWRPYTHIQDAAEILTSLLTIDRKKLSGQIFNAGTENAQKKEIVQLVKKYIPTIVIKNKGGKVDNRDYRVSFEKLKKVLGISPARSIEEGVKEMVFAMENNIFTDPYDDRFNIWLNENAFK